MKGIKFVNIKMMIQAHLDFGNFTIFSIKYFAIKFFCITFFMSPNSKSVIAALCIVTIEKSELTSFLILYFHGYVVKFQNLLDDTRLALL